MLFQVIIVICYNKMIDQMYVGMGIRWSCL